MSIAETARRSIGATRNPATEEAILMAATEILAEAGYGGFSIEAVARRAKAGKPTIYRWWPSKAHLLLDVYQRLKDVDMVEPDTGTLEGDLVAFLTNLADFWDGTPGRIFCSLVAEAQTDATAAAALSAYTADRVAHTSALFERARARNELRPDADSLAASDLLSAFAWKLVLTGRLKDQELRIKAVARTMARGLLA